MKRPSASAYFEAFGGRFYGPVSPPVVETMHSDWGEHDGRPSSLGLVTSLDAGKGRERLLIRNGLYPESTTALVHGLLFRDPTRPFRFPLLVERGKARISVDGRERTFTIYTYRGHVVATAAVCGVAVTVGCRASFLPAVRLGTLELGQLNDLVRHADEFGRHGGRGSSRSR